MKNTMNSRNIAKYHKLLDAEVSLKKISAFLKVSEATLKKFTPEKVAAAKGLVSKAEKAAVAAADAAGSPAATKKEK